MAVFFVSDNTCYLRWPCMLICFLLDDCVSLLFMVIPTAEPITCQSSFHYVLRNSPPDLLCCFLVSWLVCLSSLYLCFRLVSPHIYNWPFHSTYFTQLLTRVREQSVNCSLTYQAFIETFCPILFVTFKIWYIIVFLLRLIFHWCIKVFRLVGLYGISNEPGLSLA